MAISDTDPRTGGNGVVIITKTLWDAFEKKQYGDYYWQSGVGKFTGIAPTICYVIGDSGEKQVCHSSDEFDALTKHYMEE